MATVALVGSVVSPAGGVWLSEPDAVARSFSGLPNGPAGVAGSGAAACA
jgi:hypothetical protein